MGYTTNFRGQFDLDQPLTIAQKNYLNRFSGTRRMKRDPVIARDYDDPMREKVGLPIGTEGEYYVGNGEDFGQKRDGSIVDYNSPSSTQPGLWCQWVANEDGDAIEWDGGEKFYEYVTWIEYIIENFLVPWGRTLNGEVIWQGEECGDVGVLQIVDNKVTAHEGITSLDPHDPSNSYKTAEKIVAHFCGQLTYDDDKFWQSLENAGDYMWGQQLAKLIEQLADEL